MYQNNDVFYITMFGSESDVRVLQMTIFCNVNGGSNDWFYTFRRNTGADFVRSYIFINITTALIVYCNSLSHGYYVISIRHQIDNVIPLLKYHNTEYLNKDSASTTNGMS